MNKRSQLILFFSFIFILLQIGCTNYPVIQEPDIQMFNETVHSQSLRDSVAAGKLTSGMPRLVLNQLFENWSDNLKETKIPVASLGSKQRLVEVEGWNRQYVDPNISILLDKYETPSGYPPNFLITKVSKPQPRAKIILPFGVMGVVTISVAM